MAIAAATLADEAERPTKCRPRAEQAGGRRAGHPDRRRRPSADPAGALLQAGAARSDLGFVTRGKGVSIHRASCANLARARRDQPERLIESAWGRSRDEVFPVDIIVESGDRPGLLRDLSEIFSREKINVTAVNTLSKQHLARMSFTLEVEGLERLKRTLALVKDLKGVLSAGRR